MSRNNRYKVLPLDCLFSNTLWQYEPLADDENPITDDEVFQLAVEDLKEQGFRQITPLFYRDGWYYNRITNFCWHEWNRTAWEGDAEQFKYELNQHNTRILEPAEVKAIQTLITYGSCNLELRQLLWDHHMKERSRSSYREVRKSAMRIWKQLDKRGEIVRT